MVRMQVPGSLFSEAVAWTLKPLHLPPCSKSPQTRSVSLKKVSNPNPPLGIFS